jgi:hypothetical protein
MAQYVKTASSVSAMTAPMKSSAPTTFLLPHSSFQPHYYRII